MRIGQMFGLLDLRGLVEEQARKYGIQDGLVLVVFNPRYPGEEVWVGVEGEKRQKLEEFLLELIRDYHTGRLVNVLQEYLARQQESSA